MTHEISRMLNARESRTRRVGVELAGWQRSVTLEGLVQSVLIEDIDESVRRGASEALDRMRDEASSMSLLDQVGLCADHECWNLLEGIISLADPFLLKDRRDPLGFRRALENCPPAVWHWTWERLKTREKAVDDDSRSLRRKNEEV